MKHIKNPIRLLAIFTLLIGISHLSKAQCNPSDYTETCISNLDSTFHYIKSFSLDGQDGAAQFTEHSYVFTKDTDYLINWCTMTDVEDAISLEILDQNRLSVANSKDGTLKDQLEFSCKTTGIYYLRYSFNNVEDYCGGSAMGFRLGNP